MKKRMVSRAGMLLLLSVFILLLILPSSAFAGEYHDSSPKKMITEEFNTDIQAAADYSFHIEETIKIDFKTSHHGICRYIPLSDSYEIENVQVDSGQNYEVETDDEDENLLIRIGDEDTTVKGKKTYQISYDLSYYKETDASADFLSLDLLPTGWDTSIRESTIHLSMPYDVNWHKIRLYCGQYGASDFPEDKVSVSSDGTELSLQASDLKKGEGITVDGKLPENYWNEATCYYERHPVMSVLCLLLMAAAMLLSVIFWFRYGRDKYKMYRPVTVRPPRGMTPLEVGYYYNGGAEDKDVMSMLFYYANKGYIRIRQISDKEKGFFKSKKDSFELVKQKNADETEKNFSRNLLDGIFKTMGEKSVSLEKFNERLQEEEEDNFISQAQSEVEAAIEVKDQGTNTGLRIFTAALVILAMAAAGWIAGPEEIWLAGPVAVGWAFGVCLTMKFVDLKKKGSLVLGLLLTVASELLMWWMMTDIGGIYEILMLLMIPISTVFISLMGSPSEEYLKIMGEIFGFRDYIRKVDEQRLRKQLAESPDYFYDILPYAVVFGLETEWSAQFTELGITPSNPSWYDSTDAFVYSSMWTQGLVSSVGDSFHYETDSGSSGGGSFSGGGGGGGGGGGW